MVELIVTIGSYLRIGSMNICLFKNPVKMLPNISVRVSSVGSCTLKIWKNRMNLGVKAYLPPPGGAAAATTVNFSIDFQKKLGLS